MSICCLPLPSDSRVCGRMRYLSTKGHSLLRMSSFLVCLDSDKAFVHVCRESCAYATLVTPDSYCIVYDRVVKYMRPELRSK